MIQRQFSEQVMLVRYNQHFNFFLMHVQHINIKLNMRTFNLYLMCSIKSDPLAKLLWNKEDIN